MKRAVVLFTIVLAFALSASAQGIAVGATMDDFTLQGTDGGSHSLSSLKGKNGAVVIFLSAQCPVVKGYIERINAVAADYKEKGITFIGINSNSTEDLKWVKSDADQNFKFPVLIDKGNVLADKLGATVTPETYYVDAKNVLLYHGAIDNDKSGKAITETYLRTAFDESLAGKKVANTRKLAFGCSIKKVGAQ
ncbi:MAG: redoxin domain-containing protein [Pyrinomonadaceae bacterium]